MSQAHLPPTAFPDWATDDAAAVSQPSAALTASGFSVGARPTAQETNWTLRTIGQWIRALSGQSGSLQYATTLDGAARLSGGGLWSFNASSGVLSWSQPINILFPSVPLGSNQIAGPGQVTLAASQLAFVNANVPLTTTAAIVSGNAAIEVSFNGGIAAGMTAIGQGIPSGTTVQSVSTSDANSITLSQAATTTQSNAQLTFSASGPLSVQASTPDSLAPTSNTVVFALRHPTFAAVGINAGWSIVRDGELKYLHGTNGFGAVQQVTAGVALPAHTAVFVSDGSAGNTAGLAYPCIAAGGANANQATCMGITAAAIASGQTGNVVQSGAVSGFSGSQALSPGAVYFVSPSAPGTLQIGAPSAAGQWVLQVGQALSASTLMMSSPNRAAQQVYADAVFNSVQVTNGVSAASVTSASGFCFTIPMGSVLAQNAVYGNYYQSLQACYNQTSAALDAQGCVFTAQRKGSLVGLGIDFLAGPSSPTSSIVASVQVNGKTPASLSPPYGASFKQYSSTFPKGQNVINAGDTIACYAVLTNPQNSSQTGNSGSRIQLGFWLAIEYAA